MKNTLYFWLAAGGMLNGLVWGEGSGNPTWDNEAEDLAGNPDSSFHSDDNWNPDAVPGATDDACILEHTDAANPVTLVSTSAELKSLICKVPFSLRETLILSAASEFENSLLASSAGRIRTSEVVTFKGNNDLSGVTLEGTGGFFNEGKALVGSRGISTPFINQDEVTMVAGSSRLGEFENNGLLNLGERGDVNSSSTLTNFGTIKKDDDTADSFITANLYMKGGLIEVTPGTSLDITGAEQEFEGGTVKVDGELLLSTSVGGTPVRVFNGLTALEGEGKVTMTREYTLEDDLSNQLMNAPGLIPNDLVFGKEAPEPGSATLTNDGYLTITGVPKFTLAREEDEESLFLNAAAGTVEQNLTSNPRFDVPVRNVGSWTSSTMSLQDFVNEGTFLLRGDKTIRPADLSEPAVFLNKSGGMVRMDSETVFNRYVVSTEYQQEEEGRTEVNQGILTLEGGAALFAGEFEVSSSSKMALNKGVYWVAGSGRLKWQGEGLVTIGGSQLTPSLIGDFSGRPGGIDTVIESSLGLDGNNFVDDEKGVEWSSGLINLRSGALVNTGFFRWKGGTFDEGTLSNYRRMEISSGQPKVLSGKLGNFFNYAFALDQQGLVQSAFLTMANGSNGERGSIENCGVHEFLPGAGIAGGDSFFYSNEARMVCRDGASVVLSCSIINEGLIVVREDSVLSLPFLTNLSSDGVLRGGNYLIEPDSTLILPYDIDVLTGGEWSGPGARTVSSVTGAGSKLTKTSSETHPNALTCSDGATFECEASCVTTMPACTFETGAFWVGVGQLTTTTGPTLVRDATVSPGNEEQETGTLTVSGDLELEAEASYECDFASSVERDQVVVTSGTLDLGGTFRPAFLNSYEPALGVSFGIASAPTISGAFDFVDQSELPIGIAPTLTYSLGTVSVSFDSQTLGLYGDWVQTRFTPAEQVDLLISGPDADPDGDGQTNAEEYAHGLNPKKSEPSPVEIVAATNSSMDLTFPWAIGTEASYQALTSTELAGLLARSSTELSSVALEPGVNQVTIRVSFAQADEQFGQLEVSLP